MQASPERYGTRPGNPSTPEDGRMREGRLGSSSRTLNLRAFRVLDELRTDLLDLRTSATNVSRPYRYSDLAQLVEQAAVNRRVQGSSP